MAKFEGNLPAITQNGQVFEHLTALLQPSGITQLESHLAISRSIVAMVVVMSIGENKIEIAFIPKKIMGTKLRKNDFLAGIPLSEHINGEIVTDIDFETKPYNFAIEFVRRIAYTVFLKFQGKICMRREAQG